MYVFTLDVSFDHQTLERAAKLDEKAGIKQKQQQKNRNSERRETGVDVSCTRR